MRMKRSEMTKGELRERREAKKAARRAREALAEAERTKVLTWEETWVKCWPYTKVALKYLCGCVVFWLCWKRAMRNVPTDLIVSVFCIAFPFAGVWYVTPAPERPPRVSVEAMYIYPVKSCGAVPLYRSELDAYCGLANDRRWMIVDSDGVFLSQRRFPKLSLVRPSLPPELEGKALRLDAPGMPSLDVPVLDRGRTRGGLSSTHASRAARVVSAIHERRAHAVRT